MSHTLKLVNTPAGFDVFKVERGGRATPAAAGVTVTADEFIRCKRQAQFVGSAELVFEIDGELQPAEETGLADVREDTVVDAPGSTPAYRLQTNSFCSPKK